jgi:hypothetical protein
MRTGYGLGGHREDKGPQPVTSILLNSWYQNELPLLG